MPQATLTTAPPPAPACSFTLHVRGRITSAACRFNRAGVPLVELEMRDVSTGQVIVITRTYHDASPASAMAASCLARRLNSLHGQFAEARAMHPRFHAHRLECQASLIYTPDTQPARKDLE